MGGVRPPLFHSKFLLKFSGIINHFLIFLSNFLGGGGGGGQAPPLSLQIFIKIFWHNQSFSDFFV